MDSKKVIVCDLDGTLAPSKSPLLPEMAELLGKILQKYKLAVVSGGAFSQFEKQFLSGLGSTEYFENLSLFPTMGTTCFLYQNGEWKRVYDEPLSGEERKLIIQSLETIVAEFGLQESEYGKLIEDRESQVTLSALGQSAPLSLKETWDPDQSKRKPMAEKLKATLPQFEVRIGGTTSIDITKKGLDKAYAISKIKEILHVSDEDIVFVGDALYPGGNDEAVKKTPVDFIQVTDPDQALEVLGRYL